MLSSDLAELYAVDTFRLNEAVKRNIRRFPDDFMFQITKEEYAKILTSQFAMLRHGEFSKYLPYAFTEQGIAMLSGVLNSDRAIIINIEIMRVFVSFRRYLLTPLSSSRRRGSSIFKTRLSAGLFGGAK